MQVPFPRKQKLPPLPNIGYTMPMAGYQGPRITKAPVTVASHVKAYYWFCVLLVAIVLMAILGVAATVVGANMQTLCPASTDLMTWLFIFGVTDMAIAVFILIIIIVRALCCSHRSVLLGWIAVLAFAAHCLAFFLYALFALIIYQINIFAEIYTTYSIYSYYNSAYSPRYYCNKNVRNFAILLFVLVTIGLIVPIVYMIALCKRKFCGKTGHKTAVVPPAP